METKFLPKSESEVWNEFVNASPHGAIFNKTFYLDALEVNYRILVAYNKQGIQGGIILSQDKWGYHTNPILCKYLGVLFNTFDGSPYKVESKQRDVQRSLLVKLSELNSFEFSFHPEYKNWLPCYSQGYQQSSRITYRIDLSKLSGDQDLLENMSSRLRNKITKALRESEFKVEHNEDSSVMFPIMERTYARQKIKMPVDRGRLSQLMEVLQSNSALQMIVSKDGQGKVGAILGLFYDQNAAYLILNGVADELNERGINEVLIYEGICWARSKGLRYFDFEGSMMPSIESFYRQFGGEMIPYFVIWKEGGRRMLRRLKQRLV